MQYALVLGRVYTLSLAEAIAVLRANGTSFVLVACSPEVAIIETEAQLDHEALERRLGGTIKIVKIVDVLKKRERDSVNFALQNYFKPGKLKKDYFKDFAGKKQFGISIYLLSEAVQAFGEPRRLGMFIKKGLQDSGVSLRAVLPDFNALALPSVSVTKNLILQKGAEIVVIAGTDRIYVGKTLVVQDFEDYGRRDYQRPVRDEKQGMVPPKVAQVMVNLAGVPKGKTMLDPFCGIGTILQEAILMGYKVLGSDISATAIDGSQKNLEWFRNRYQVAPGKSRLATCDVANVAEVFKGEKISAVVTEGWLGPLYSSLPKPAQIEKNFKDVKALWVSAMGQFAQVLESDSRVVVCLPAYKTGQAAYEFMPGIDDLLALGYTVEDPFPESVNKVAPFLKVTPRRSIVYDRKDQVVAREIITFIKQ